ncbi:MAG TPA: GDSL-type esterase/lipase family protein [Polyangiaceae bacterium]|nr:GDSL-type esterase/lipase family protein [Polyangiaceae bacterium]
MGEPKQLRKRRRAQTAPAQRFDMVVAALGALVAVTCAAGMRPSQRSEEVVPPPQVVPNPEAAQAQEPAKIEASSSPGAVAASASASASPSVSAGPRRVRLAKLRAALAALASSERKEHVRILWLGDSHTYADFWTHAVRQALQNKYGAAGPGYLLLGVKPYRNDLAQVRVEGKWRREPASPSSGAKQADGVFGLAGQRSVPISADAKATVQLSGKSVSGRVRWTLHYRLPGTASIEVQLDGSPKSRLSSGKSVPGSSILRQTFESDAGAKLSVRAASGSPEFFGVAVESVTPGVVLDNLGINGARAGTPLAWDEQSHIAELAARAPALVVLAYGTNEAASALSAERVVGHFTRLMARVRQAAPDADCVFVGPTDMADENGGSRPRVVEIDAAVARAAQETGCGFVSAFEAMGGEGSFARWMQESPPLGSPDRIHLTPKGYATLGKAVLQRLGLP